jgi:hypothetical protein
MNPSNNQHPTNVLLRLSVAAKNELLFKRDINFNRLPNWQKRGIGLYWEDYEKEGFNPRSGKTTKAIRRRLTVDMDLPMKEAYEALIRERVHSDTANGLSFLKTVTQSSLQRVWRCRIARFHTRRFSIGIQIGFKSDARPFLS